MFRKTSSIIFACVSMVTGVSELLAAPDLHPYKWPDTMMHEIIVHTTGELTQDQVKDNSMIEDGVLLDLAEDENGVAA